MEERPDSQRHWVPLVVLVACAAAAGVARADEAREAFAKLRAWDNLLASGRVGQAYFGYLDLARRYPTWWAPVLKAAIAARALRMETGDAGVERANTLAPNEPFARFVRGLFEIEASVPAPPKGADTSEAAELLPTDLSVRLAMARAKYAEKQGDSERAAWEYRWIATRCTRCVAASWRLARLSRDTGKSAIVGVGAGGEAFWNGSISLFPPRWRKAAAKTVGPPR